MPKCGTRHARDSMPWLTHASSRGTHAGWWGLPLSVKELPSFALVREPLSWYVSMYTFEGNREWLDYFGFTRRNDWENWPEILRKMTNPDPDWAKSRGAIDSAAFTRSNVLPDMAEFGIGLWSWWLLYSCGRSEKVDPREDLAPVQMLWLHEEREKHINALSSIDGKKSLQGVSRRASDHPSVESLYTDDLRALVQERDGPTYAKALAKPSGVEYPSTYATV